MADGSSARSPPGVLRDLGRRRAGGARPRSRARDSAAEGPTSWGALCVERALELHVPGLLADVVDWRTWQHARPRRCGRGGGLGHRGTLRGVAGLESERRDAATLLVRGCWRRVAAPCVRACVCVWCVPTRGVGASPSWVRRHEPVARVCGGRESRRAVQVPLCVRRAFPSGRDRMYVARPVRYRPGDASTAAAAASPRCTFVGHSTWTPFPTTFFPREAGSAGGVRVSPSTSAAAARPPPMHQAGLLGFTRDSETVGAATEDTPAPRRRRAGATLIETFRPGAARASARCAPPPPPPPGTCHTFPSLPCPARRVERRLT